MDFRLLSKYGISYPASKTVSSLEEALAAAEKIGYPVAMKALCSQVLHKSDRGGVVLDVSSAGEAEKAYHLLVERYRGLKLDGILVQKMAGKQAVELIVGGKRDPQFGQLIMLGMGGIFVEVMRDVAFRICPIGEQDAQEMIHELRAYPILAGARGRKPVNERALVATLLSVSRLLLSEDPKEFDINPLLADDKGCVAVDVRMLR
ncbi:MAG: acetate--CoA ligase family protein [Candidatus Micrarchaeota archaeon]|nr:acetate--CoA ligase family protein [Candidatus Micrarchaeota archaeon]